MNDDELLMATYELREKLVADVHRPRYHFCPPEGRWNDLDGRPWGSLRPKAGLAMTGL